MNLPKLLTSPIERSMAIVILGRVVAPERYIKVPIGNTPKSVVGRITAPNVVNFHVDLYQLRVRFLYKGIIINHNKNRANLH